MWRDLPQDKRAARAQVRAVRRVRAPGERAADGAALAAHLRPVIDALDAGHVASYTALPTEPPTRDIERMLRESGWQVLLPVLLSDKDLAWQDAAEDDEQPRLHGVDHIGLAALNIVPALAIDRHGLRLGQGGGSYDRALARRRPGALTVALVYDDELVDAVPSEPHDVGVDAVITPRAGLRHLTN